jgi:hypothetical protein
MGIEKHRIKSHPRVIGQRLAMQAASWCTFGNILPVRRQFLQVRGKNQAVSGSRKEKSGAGPGQPESAPLDS